ncbi:MAG: ABC transporter permease [Candidatus Tectomicrobia bacterium]|uniref:ABC transporter permease n=1 Tax=Tectimicrobiota bacterium TaxID=2528274 RepID=A0A932HZ97_UNCTE|nr:ABC transporter permease [Candidatus Tectomicrobia bacterium]
MLLMIWRNLCRSKTAIAGLVVVVGLVLTALTADFIAPYSFENPAAGSLQPPSLRHPFGTDPLGRDILTRVIYGTRVALFVGLGSISLAVLFGIPLGISSGYYGGWIDLLVMRLMDLILAFPTFLLAIVIMVILGPSTKNVVLALAIVRIPIFARVIRGSVLTVKELDYVSGARSISASDVRLLFRHILPNCLAPIIVTATVSIAFAILVEANLSFLGLGTQPPTPSWGFDLKQNMTSLSERPFIVVAPGLAIMFTVLGFNLFGDGLRDALDPRTRN